MITRLQVDGFKNLDDVDVRFGPFTCIAGPNGVGKSNLFDAIGFLSALAQATLHEAALTVRGSDGPRGGIAALFRREGERHADEMRFAVEFLLPKDGEDGLGQPVTASATYLRYELQLRYTDEDPVLQQGRLEIVHESLDAMGKTDAKSGLRFQHSRAWRDSVTLPKKRKDPYLSTLVVEDQRRLRLHGERTRPGGRPREILAASAPRTLLSTMQDGTEHPTIVLARQEMTRWTQLQLEPSALRPPDPFNAPRQVDARGGHLAATLHRLEQAAHNGDPANEGAVYADVANRLAELVPDVRHVYVDVDPKYHVLSLVVRDRQGTPHAASSLSDGTLRFLALTILEADPKSPPVLCLEEPENGIHPRRVEAVINLLRDLSVDVDLPVSEDNPLRQVIINTHAPAVIGAIHDGELLAATLLAHAEHGRRSHRLALRHLSGTWRGDDPTRWVPRGELLSYLNPLGQRLTKDPTPDPDASPLVRDRDDLQSLLPFGAYPEGP